MTSKIGESDYDENCVFNRLFEEKNSVARESSRGRLDRIFMAAKTPYEPIDVADFLPIY